MTFPILPMPRVRYLFAYDRSTARGDDVWSVFAGGASVCAWASLANRRAFKRAGFLQVTTA